jgi:ATP-binding cassette, subfamily B, bacterial
MQQLGNLLKRKLSGAQRLLPALRLVWQSSPGWTMARTGLLVVQGILPLVTIYLAKLIVDAVTAGLTQPNKDPAFNQIVGLLVIAMGVALLTILCSSLAELINNAQTQRVMDYMQSVLNAKSIAIDLEYYEDPRYYDTLQRAQQEAPHRPSQILSRLAQLIQNTISLVAMVGLLLALHWGVIVILFLAALPAMLVRINYTKAVYRWQREWTPSAREASYLAWILTTDSFAKEIRLFNLGTFFSNRFDTLRKDLFRALLGLFTRRFAAFFSAQAIAGIFLFAIYGMIIYQTLYGTLKLGDLVLYHQALQQGQEGLRSLMAALSGLYEDNLFLANLYEFLDLQPRMMVSAQPKPVPQPMQKGIVFEGVDFSYANTPRQALHDISLVVRPGETIALVGENGSGKTTLIKLLCRLYDPTAGRILIDGIDIRDLDVTELRQQISVIFQDYAKYNLTAQDNIWLGNITLPHTEEGISRAARRAGADEVIRKLPHGYHTILGKLFAQGEELSIGQWQKVALARAFLRDSQVIVLDEPTSAMDPKAEYEVFKKFRELIQDQAAILITHRLSTVKMADRIYVMDQGRIVESGTHEQLLQLEGIYADLFETQAQSYRYE